MCISRPSCYSSYSSCYSVSDGDQSVAQRQTSHCCPWPVPPHLRPVTASVTTAALSKPAGTSYSQTNPYTSRHRCTRRRSCRARGVSLIQSALSGAWKARRLEMTLEPWGDSAAQGFPKGMLSNFKSMLSRFEKVRF